MRNLFLVKVKLEKTMESGLVKKVSELYLFNAMSFTEAEARVMEELACYSDFCVSEIRKARYSELITTADPQADKYYACKVNYITIDEKTGAEKKDTVQMLVQAESTDDAGTRIEEVLSQGMANYQIISIVETKIIDYFPYVE